ncbi:MAG TPA: glycerol-3-phosphate acyltransferase [Acidimicrobiales bacterium]|nr:glycerol-3-phosphate acyltransferase [Acidimicrobiales bacterium]
MSAVAAAAVVLAGYALGTFPTAVLVGRRRGFDPTAAGSGNPGASNVTRIGGARAGALVLLGDAGKGALAAGLGYVVDGRTLAWFAGAAAVAGHLWPVTRRFRGGKGVATAAGVGSVCAPLAAVAMGLVFAALVKLSGRAAVGSIAIAALFPVAVAALGQSAVEVAVATAVAVVIIVRHRSNIQRLLEGSESRVRSRRR